MEGTIGMSRKEKVQQLFEDMHGCRYCSYQEMEDWFRKKTKEPLPNLVIRECSGINSEITEGKTDVDFATDCTFGENVFEQGWADFTVNYIKDNAGKMYVTSVIWS